MNVKRSRRLLFLLFVVTLSWACGEVGDRVDVTLGSSPYGDGSATANRDGAASRDYTAPDGAFAIKIPAGWKVEREEKDGAYMTVIHPERYRAANLSIMTINAALPQTDSPDLQSPGIVGSSEPFFRGWLDGLKEQARVEGTGDIFRTRCDNLNALGMEVTYYRGDAEDPRRGYCIYLHGDRTIFFISLTASASRFEELKEIISTIQIEP